MFIIITISLTQACIQIPSATLLILYNMDKTLKPYLQTNSQITWSLKLIIVPLNFQELYVIGSAGT